RSPDRLHRHLDRIPRDEITRHPLAALEIEFLLDVVANRADGVLRYAGVGQTLLYGGHRVRILPLRIARAPGPRLDSQREVRDVRGAAHDRLARRDDQRGCRRWRRALLRASRRGTR